MSFEFTGLVWIPVVITAVCLWMILKKNKGPYDINELRIHGIIILGVCIVLWNILTAVYRSDGIGEEPLSDTTVAKELFGFESGKTYPLVLGSQSTYQQGSFDVHAGIFSASASGDFVGGTTITVAFTQDDTTYTLSLPRDSTPIKIDDATEPHMVVHLREGRTANGRIESTGYDCRTAVVDFGLASRCARVEEELAADPGVREAGLGKLVAESFSSAEITMTQTMYDQMIGKIE